MALSFDPDWQVDTVTDQTDPAQVVGILPEQIPAGSEGDTLVLFMVLDANVNNEQPGVTGVFQSGDVDGELTVRAEAIQSNGGATILTATGVRIAGLEALAIALSPGTGPYGYALGNFPSETVPRVLVEENYPYEPRLSESVGASGSGIFAGMMVSDENPGVGVSFPGAGDSATASFQSTDYEAVVWAYESSAADAVFDLTGDWITYAIVLGVGGSGWHVGKAGWGGSW